jgi:hypothetical protein
MGVFTDFVFRNGGTHSYWIVFILFISLLALVGDVSTSRFDMRDFEVYHKTARRALHGEELYSIPEDGHYVFKYSPVAGILFIPLAVLPLPVAQYVYWALLTILFIVGIRLFAGLLETAQVGHGVDCRTKHFVFFALLSVVMHFHRELHLGQVNMLLLVMYIFLTEALVKNKAEIFGWLLGASIFIKPFGLIFLPYLIVKRKYMEVAYTVAILGFLSLLPFIFYPSVEAVVRLYSSWWDELVTELAVKQNLLAGGNHTIFSVLARFTPIRFVLENVMVQKLYQLILLGWIGLSVWRYIKRNDSIGNHAEAVVKEMALLMAFIPLLAFTSENAFVFALPVVLCVMFHYGGLTVMQKVLLVCGMVCIGGNIYDVVGRGVNHFLLSLSIYTWGTLLVLLVLVFYERSNGYKKTKAGSSPALS